MDVKTNERFPMSASRVMMFEVCPLQYLHSYIKKTYTTKKVEDMLLVGSLVHEALERLAAYPVEENIEHCVAMGIKQMTEKSNEVLTPEHVKQSVDMIKNWFDPSKFAKKCAGTEEPFDFTFDDVRLLGFIDRAEWEDEHTLRIIDYKSGGRIYTEEEMRTSNQLLIYAMAAYEKWQPERVIVCYDMVMYNKRVEVLVDDEDIREKFKYLKLIYNSILGLIEDSTNVKALVGPHCSWCNYKSICPDYKIWVTGELGMPSIKMVQEGNFEDTMKIIVDLDAKKKAIEDYLSEVKKWVTNELLDNGNTAMTVGDYRLNVITNSRLTFDALTVATIFPDKMDKVLTVKKGEVDKLMSTLSVEEKALLMTTAMKSEGVPYLKIKKNS
jgi:RecB family exonuclease